MRPSFPDSNHMQGGSWVWAAVCLLMFSYPAGLWLQAGSLLWVRGNHSLRVRIFLCSRAQSSNKVVLWHFSLYCPPALYFSVHSSWFLQIWLFLHHSFNFHNFFICPVLLQWFSAFLTLVLLTGTLFQKWRTGFVSRWLESAPCLGYSWAYPSPAALRKSWDRAMFPSVSVRWDIGTTWHRLHQDLGIPWHTSCQPQDHGHCRAEVWPQGPVFKKEYPRN